MDTKTVLLIILAAIVALGLVLFQYYYKSKKRGKLGLWLSFLRFIAWFGAFLLVINPKFSKNSYTLEKATLLVLVDNSTSVKGSKIQESLQKMKESTTLSDKFDIQYHSFGDKLNASDSLSFHEKNTNISKALNTLETIYGNSNRALVLITDGNQTVGEDYEFYTKSGDTPIYSVAVGDTTRYEDVRVGQLNVNKYAFLKNKFPLEVYVNYEGEGTVTANVTITENGKVVYREDVGLSKTRNSKVINTLLDASAVGLKNISVSVEKLNNERNVANNQRTAAVEVIDEKTNIAIVSEVMHPDIGALKKSIERNEQRAVVIRKPTNTTTDLESIDLFILYQPTARFSSLYRYIKQKKANTFTITGPKTDWSFLNRAQNSFTKNSYEQAEETGPVQNAGFSIFNTEDFDSTDFPPLSSNLGDIIINKSHEVLLGQRIKGVELNQPLWAVLGDDLEREAILFGENVWKWRMQSYRNQQDFTNFDALMGKLIRYLSTNKPKARFTVDYESVYEGNSEAKLTATYFDEAFIFDGNATINLQLRNKDTGKEREIPMLLKGGYYEADFSDIPAGQYDFTAKVVNEGLFKSGSFAVLDFDVEQQFLSTDYKKLGRLADNTDAGSYFSTQTDDLIQDLLGAERFVPTQKSEQNIVSLIDFKFLLGIIVAALALEWLLRKYNGLT